MNPITTITNQLNDAPLLKQFRNDSRMKPISLITAYPQFRSWNIDSFFRVMEFRMSLFLQSEGVGGRSPKRATGFDSFRHDRNDRIPLQAYLEIPFGDFDDLRDMQRTTGGSAEKQISKELSRQLFILSPGPQDTSAIRPAVINPSGQYQRHLSPMPFGHVRFSGSNTHPSWRRLCRTGMASDFQNSLCCVDNPNNHRDAGLHPA